MPMKILASTLALGLMATSAVIAQQPGPVELMKSVPGHGVTVTDYYKQNVYDPSDAKIGEISDLLVDDGGRVNAVIVSVGGFLGMGDKDVAAPFRAIHITQKDGKSYLVMDTTKEALKGAPGYKYDKTSTTWVPDNK